MKIQKLNQAQTELLSNIVQKRIEKFLFSQQINITHFEGGINWLYSEILKRDNPEIIYCNSWFDALSKIDKLKHQENSYENTISPSLWTFLTRHFNETLKNSVDTSVQKCIRETIKESVNVSIINQTWSSVWKSYRISGIDQKFVTNILEFHRKESQFESIQLYFHLLTGLDFLEKIDPIEKDIFRNFKKLMNSGFFQVYDCGNFVLAIHPPKNICRDNQGRLNSISGKAFEWIDGTGHFYINGVELPEDLYIKIKERKYTLEDFANEKNEEIKSAIISFIQQRDGENGICNFFKSYLTETDIYIDKKKDSFLEGTTKGMNIGVYTLYRGKINRISVAFVQCYCPSTDRMFFLGVEPKYKSAKNAIASLYQIPTIVKNDIKTISRQGERFFTTFTEEGYQKLKSLKEITEYSKISGDEYFAKMTYEF